MDEEEFAHYAEVLLSMKEYEGFVWREGFRKKQHLKRLNEKHARRLPAFTVKDSIPAMLRYAKTNQEFWDQVCAMQANFGPEVDLPSHINLKQPMKTPYRHYSKLKSTLHQLVRDWAVEVGMSITMNQQKVLVPGAGLGRLALEIVSAGYATQGNEFSYQMLFT
ncbi:hypothetical protein B5M09_007382, partial [Aphanomyces astaci]